jgi:transcriptional regulator with XRE-family HTH domain
MSEALAQSDQASHPKVGSIIRARRRQRQMTLQDLGEAAGVSVGYLSQVERDRATPSLGTLAQIARALEVGIDYFIATPGPREALTRADERPKFSVDGSSVIYERLGAEFPGNVLSSFVLTVPPGYRSEVVSHEGEEMLYVLEGAITQRLDDEEMIMSAGDSLHFRGSRPHAWSNHTDAPAKLLWTGTLALFRSSASPRPVLATDKKSGGKPVARTRSRTLKPEERKS